MFLAFLFSMCAVPLAKTPHLPPPPPPTVAYTAIDSDGDLDLLRLHGMSWMLSAPARAQKQPVRMQEITELIQRLSSSPVDIRVDTDGWIRFARLLLEEGLERAAQAPAAGTEWFTQSLSVSEKIATRVDGFPRHDEAMYWMIVNLHLLHQGEQMEEIAQIFLDTYPNSLYTPEVYILVGEEAFEQRPAVAARAFAAAAEVSPFATHRLAWCQLRLGETDGALETLQAVLADDRTEPPLAVRSLRDFITINRDIGADTDSKLTVLQAFVGDERFQSIMLAMAREDFSDAHYQESIEAYRYLLAAAPNAADAPIFQYEIIRAYRARGETNWARLESDRMRRTYNERSLWWRKNSKDERTIEIARTLTARLR